MRDCKDLLKILIFCRAYIEIVSEKLGLQISKYFLVCWSVSKELQVKSAVFWKKFAYSHHVIYLLYNLKPSNIKKLKKISIFNFSINCFSRFGIEKEVRVCDSCYSQLQAGRAPAQGGPSSSKRVTWADDQNWQDEQAAVLAKYAQHAKKEQRKAEANHKAQEEVSF